MSILKIADHHFLVPDDLNELLSARCDQMERKCRHILEGFHNRTGIKSSSYIETIYNWMKKQCEDETGYTDTRYITSILFLETIYPYAVSYPNERWELIEDEEIDTEDYLNAVNQRLEFLDLETVDIDGFDISGYGDVCGVDYS